MAPGTTHFSFSRYASMPSKRWRQQPSVQSVTSKLGEQHITLIEIHVAVPSLESSSGETAISVSRESLASLV